MCVPNYTLCFIGKYFFNYHFCKDNVFFIKYKLFHLQNFLTQTYERLTNNFVATASYFRCCIRSLPLH